MQFVLFPCKESPTETEGQTIPGVHIQQLDPLEKMSYTMQALKRNHCLRLARFIRLCDYIVVNMLHDLTLASVRHILFSLQELLNRTIEIEDIAKPIPEDEEDDETVPLLPLRTPTSVTQNTSTVS